MSQATSNSGTVAFLQKLRESQAKMPDQESMENTSTLQVQNINPSKILRWKEKDRPDNELGDIDALAQSFVEIGQQVPCIVRPSSTDEDKYELIAGERRWRAAIVAEKPLKVIVQSLDDRTAALVQAVENEQRNDLSDYARGMSYAKKIKSGLLTQKDLTEILSISKQQVSRLLSFSRLSQPITDAVGDFRKVSARTAEELCRLAAKDTAHENAIIQVAEKIRKGNFGEKKLKQHIESIVHPKQKNQPPKDKVFSDDGRHLFTWRLDNNASPSIHFPKSIMSLIQTNKLNIDGITENIKKHFIQELEKIGHQSPRGDNLTDNQPPEDI